MFGGGGEMSINGGGGGYYEGNSIGGREVNVPTCMQGNRLKKKHCFSQNPIFRIVLFTKGPFS